MGTVITALIIGILVGVIWSWLVKAITKKSTLMLVGLNSLFGAIGAIAATKLIVFGPMLFGVSIIPAIAGAIVLAFLVTYVFIKVSNR